MMNNKKPFAIHNIILDDGTTCEVTDWAGIMPRPTETMYEYFARWANGNDNRQINISFLCTPVKKDKQLKLI